jgi:hypothetical protein
VIRFLRVVKSNTEEDASRRAMTALCDRARIKARIEVVRSLDPPLQVIARTSGSVADLVFLGMVATGAEEARRSLDAVDPLLEHLPTTLLVWSNGEADVFA